MDKQSAFNPWLAILLTAPVPIILCVLFFFKWYEQKTDLARVTSYFVERQNTVLAYDAMRVSQKVSQLLELADKDVQTVALLPRSVTHYAHFYETNTSKLTRYDAKAVTTNIEMPLYREISVIGPTGAETVRVTEGKRESNRSLEQCQLKELCDQDLRKSILKEPEGSVLYGKLMRHYTPRTDNENHKGASLSVATKTKEGAIILAIDYEHLREVLFVPTFPYESRRKLLQSYLDGNYTYFVDQKFDFLAHPKHWHVIGIDKVTGQWVTPAKTDEDLGTHPVNVAVYQGEQLKDYFNRLLNVSFAHRAADLFRAPNLTGKIRVHAVAPIVLSKGQFKESGIYGHVITGCYVDYFEEPKEKFLPYY